VLPVVMLCRISCSGILSLAHSLAHLFIRSGMQDGKEVVFGANVSQTRAIEELQKGSQPEPFHRMADHLLRIAGQLSCVSALLISFSVFLHFWSALMYFCIAVDCIHHSTFLTLVYPQCFDGYPGLFTLSAHTSTR